jgi:hypothetical protein
MGSVKANPQQNYEEVSSTLGRKETVYSLENNLSRSSLPQPITALPAPVITSIKTSFQFL